MDDPRGGGAQWDPGAAPAPVTAWPYTEFKRPDGARIPKRIDLSNALAARCEKAALVVGVESLEGYGQTAVYLRHRGIEEEDESTRLLPMQHPNLTAAIEAYLKEHGF